jgi:hypothetical protein
MCASLREASQRHRRGLLSSIRLIQAEKPLHFEAFLKAALRLDALALRAWLRRRLKNPPLAEPIDLARFAISDADIALLLRAGEAAAGPDRDKANGG